MHYFASFGSFFAHPKWGMQLLLGGVCMLIPLLGIIVFLGYLAEVIAAQHQHGELTYPAFDFDRFSRYLNHGIRQVLVQLVVGLCAIPIAILVLAPLLAIPVLHLEGPSIAAPIAATVLLYVAAVLGMIVLSVPLFLRAALTQSFSDAFSLAFVKEFIRRVWWQTILSQLFLAVTAVPLVLVGYLACFIGVYPAMAVLTFAMWQLYRQLYELFLARGGPPLELAPGLSDRS